MVSFINFVARPAMDQVIEKSLFGKPYFRLGKLFIVIVPWLYQQAGALGLGLKGHPVLLGKLIGTVPEKAPEFIASLNDVARAHLVQVKERENTFFDITLYVKRQLEVFGIDITAYPPSKKLNDKVSAKDASEIMVVTFIERAALGYHFPEDFREYWRCTYRLLPDSEWQKARASGVVLSETQKARPLDAAVADLISDAVKWASEQALGLFDDSELHVLNSLAAKAGNAT